MKVLLDSHEWNINPSGHFQYPDEQLAPMLGPYLPQFVEAYVRRSDDETTPQQWFDKVYAHGGGWMTFAMDKWKFNPEDASLEYPGDPRLFPIASTKMGDFNFHFYQSAIVVLENNNGFEVSRMD